MKKIQPSTAERILEAAEEIFAECGFAGARIDAIAKRAKVNQMAIYYHIGNKEKIYEEVLQRIFGELPELIEKDIQDIESPEAQLSFYIRKLAQMISQHPHIRPMLLREMATDGRHIPGVVHQMILRLEGILSNILQRGEQQGMFTPTSPILIIDVISSLFILRTMEIRKNLSPEVFRLSQEHREERNKYFEERSKALETFILNAVKK